MRLYDVHCEMWVGVRGCLCTAGGTDALHASLSLRNAGCEGQDLSDEFLSEEEVRHYMNLDEIEEFEKTKN